MARGRRAPRGSARHVGCSSWALATGAWHAVGNSSTRIFEVDQLRQAWNGSRPAALARLLVGGLLALGAQATAVADPAANDAAATSAPPMVWIHTEARTAAVVDTRAMRIVRTLTLPAEPVAAGRLSADRQRLLVALRDGRLAAVPLASDDPTRWHDLGQPIGSVAVSGDGRWMLVALQDRPELVLLDDQLREKRRWPTVSRDGRRRGPAAGIVDLPLRRSLVVSLPSIDELWEVSYDERAEDIYDGLVHDFRMGEGVPLRGFLNPRRSRINGLPAHLVADVENAQLIGATTAVSSSAAGIQLINLDVRRRVAAWPLGQVAQPFAAAAWMEQGRGRMALALAGGSRVQWLDTTAMQAESSVTLPARVLGSPGTTDRSPWLWVVIVDDGGTSALLRLEKSSGGIASRLPLDGRAVGAPTASADGCSMLIATAGQTPALLAFDSFTGQPAGRLALAQPPLRAETLPLPGPPPGTTARTGC